MVMLKAIAPARGTPPPKVKPKNGPVKPAPSGTPAPARTVVAAPPARTAVVTVPVRSTVAAAAPARARKTTSATQSVRPELAAVDSDIALLSAIIMHASRHAGERAQIEAAQCGAGKKCAPPADLLGPLKATD
jgi:hypothetical protein